MGFGVIEGGEMLEIKVMSGSTSSECVQNHILVDVNNFGGFSGGPILDGEGRVVGVLSQGVKSGVVGNNDNAWICAVEGLREWMANI